MVTSSLCDQPAPTNSSRFSRTRFLNCSRVVSFCWGHHNWNHLISDQMKRLALSFVSAAVIEVRIELTEVLKYASTVRCHPTSCVKKYESQGSKEGGGESYIVCVSHEVNVEMAFFRCDIVLEIRQSSRQMGCCVSPVLLCHFRRQLSEAASRNEQQRQQCVILWCYLHSFTSLSTPRETL